MIAFLLSISSNFVQHTYLPLLKLLKAFSPASEGEEAMEGTSI
jgi:hypothetical protein